MQEDIVWSEHFSVGVPAMDEEHKKLIAMLNQLRHRDETGTAFNIVMQMFEYASVHFKHEEELLAHVGYSELETQKREHAAFLAKTSSFSESNMDDPALCDDLLVYLLKWMVHHILEEDMKYKRCIPERFIQ